MILTSKGISLTTLLLIIGIFLLALIFLYIVFYHVRIKSASKKIMKSKKLIKKYSKESKEVKELIESISTSKKYNGKLKSVKSSVRKKIKKYFKKWAVEVTYFVALSRKTVDKKDCQVHFVFQNKKDLKKKRIGLDIVVDPVKNAKNTYKKLVKALKKYPCTLSFMKVLTSIFDQEVKYSKMDKKEKESLIPEHYMENDCLVYAFITPKTKLRKPFDFNKAKKNEDVNIEVVKDENNGGKPKQKEVTKETSLEDEVLKDVEDILTGKDTNANASINDIEFKTLDEIDK